jgi:hypothetical protein
VKLSLTLAVLICNASAADHWVEVQRGPFRVVSENVAAAKTTLGQLEQFRYAFGLVTGVKEPKLVWPLDVVLAKPSPLGLSRNARFVGLPEKNPLSADFLRSLTAIFLDENLKRLPEDIEQQVLALFSTFQNQGTHITLGGSPDGGMVQALVSQPSTLGEVHILLYNLQQGADRKTACRTAFQKPCESLPSSSLATTEIIGAAINANRDFRADPLDSGEVGLALADLALAAGATDAAAKYQALHGPEADAGLGLAAAAAGKKDDARKHFADAVANGTKSARVYLETDPQRAAALNPRWDEPYYAMALAAKDPAAKVDALKKAVALEPRNLAWWRKLAETATSAGDYSAAAQAWTGASLAARNEEERKDLLAERASIEERRSDAVEAEHKRQAAEEAAELDRIKQATLNRIHAAEKQANAAINEDGAAPVTGAVPYSSLDPEGPKVEGLLTNLDCRGKFALVTVTGADGKVSKFVMGDPSHLALGGSDTELSCGPQKKPRKVILEYKPHDDRKLGTLGEVRAVQFP